MSAIKRTLVPFGHPYIPHLFICINLLLLQAAIAHVAHSPVGAWVRQLHSRFECPILRIPQESLQIFSSIKPAWRRGGFQGIWETLTPLTQRKSAQAHNLGVTLSKRVGGISSPHRTGASRHFSNFKGTYGSPLTPPFKYGQGVRGDSMSPYFHPS